jgi:hypothetical protein
MDILTTNLNFSSLFLVNTATDLASNAIIQSQTVGIATVESSTYSIDFNKIIPIDNNVSLLDNNNSNIPTIIFSLSSIEPINN